MSGNFEELDFRCPKCDNNTLAAEEYGISIFYSVKRIYKNGEFNYDAADTLERVPRKFRFVCATCSYILKKDGKYILDTSDVVEWIKENCPQ